MREKVGKRDISIFILCLYLKYTDEVLLSCSFKFELRQSHPGTITRIATKFIT